MLENRELSIRLNRKDEGNKAIPSSEISIFEDKVVLLDKVIKDSVQSIFAGVCLFVVLDTVRKVVISKNSR